MPRCYYYLNMKHQLLLVLITIFSTLCLWLVFSSNILSVWGISLPRQGMGTIISNYDGPLYIVVAKTLYDFSQGNPFEFPLPNEYYAAHFPLYPLLIRTGSLFTSNSSSMIFVTLISSTLATFVFFRLSRKWLDGASAFWLTLVFLFVPARYFIVRSVGSPEPLFLLLIMLSVDAFAEKKYWRAGIWGALATLTKSPGILLFAAYCISLVVQCFRSQKKHEFTINWIGLALIPITLIGLFSFYLVRYGNFWTYFRSGDNIHLQLLPFRVFNSDQLWVGSFWLEDIIWIYALGLIGLTRLIEQKRYDFAVFVGVFLTSIFFVSHRDISRYALPIFPFILLSLGQIISRHRYRIIFLLLILPIFLYSVNFISHNTMPIADWHKLF